MSLNPVIVGGGPAGMSAAIELAQHGVQSTLLEEASRLGGVVYRGPPREGVELDYWASVTSKPCTRCMMNSPRLPEMSMCGSTIG